MGSGGGEITSRDARETSGLHALASTYGNKRQQVLWRNWRVESTQGRRENKGESGERSGGTRSRVSGSLDFTLRAVKSLHWV